MLTDTTVFDAVFELATVLKDVGLVPSIKYVNSTGAKLHSSVGPIVLSVEVFVDSETTKIELTPLNAIDEMVQSYFPFVYTIPRK